MAGILVYETMKVGVTLSSAAHVAILTWGLLSISGPKPLVVADVEALPVDIVPIESITKAVQGEKEVDLTDTPAPKPTLRPQDEPAENVGDTNQDIKAPREAPKEPAPQQAVAAPKPPKAEEPVPSPDIKPEPVPTPKEAQKPVETTEVAALNEPKVPVLEDPAEQLPSVSEAAEKFAKLPDVVPTPTVRPKPPKAKLAKTTDRKVSEDKPRSKTSASADANQSTEDKIAALLNKEDPAKGGAKRSTKQASLGTEKKGNADKLSTSEMDALRAAIEKCWNVPIGLADAENMRVTVTMQLNRNGEIEGKPSVEATGGEPAARRAFAGSAKRAVLKCAPYTLLPSDKFETWSEVVVNFDPSQMF